MSNSNNMGKELKRLRKELEDLKGKGRRFHFLVLGKDDTEDEKVKQLMDAGKFAPGDEYQVVQVLWNPRQLKGAEDIPMGGAFDPYAEPEMPLAQPVPQPWKEDLARERRWKDHIKQIERDGTRYDPDKPKFDNGIY